MRWIERLLVFAGAAMLAWCAWLVTDAAIAQRDARRSLEIASSVEPMTDVAKPDATIAAPSPSAVPAVARGEAVADLSIPRVRLSAVVLHGSDVQTLRRGPGHLENTALPGEAGNVVIAGHRDTFFQPLREVRVGDDVFLAAPHGRFHYRVESLQVMSSHDVGVLAPTDDAVLTLITCYPFWVLGPAPDRFVVRAIGVVDESDTPFAVRVARPHEPVPPVVRRPAAVASVFQRSRTPMDDEALVRQAIERFRLTYNGRLTSRRESGPGGLLAFEPCDITVADNEAVALCASSRPSEDGERQVWKFALGQAAEVGWAIRSIAMQ